LADTTGGGQPGPGGSGGAQGQRIAERGLQGHPRSASPTNGHWRDADWLFCRDGKWRPVEPGTFPLAHGAAARVGRLRAYGNAIVPQAAAEVIGAYLAT
jgi:DNA (cytosine-5)-methyltransferase 1